MNDIERRIAYETSRFLALCAKAGLPTGGVGARGGQAGRTAAGTGKELPDGRSRDLRWLPADWRTKAGPPVPRRSKAALDACQPTARTCPHCAAGPGYLTGSFIDGRAVWHCGRCGAIRNQRW